MALTTVAKFSGLMIAPSLMLAAGFFYLSPQQASLPPGGNVVKTAKASSAARGAGAGSVDGGNDANDQLMYQSPPASGDVSGVRSIYTNGVPSFQFYLLGRFSQMASWYYYLIAMLVEDARRHACRARDRRRSPSDLALAGSKSDWLLFPWCSSTIVCSQDPVTLGLRRVLFVYPFLFLWGGVRLYLLWERWWPARRRDTIGTALAAGLLLIVIAGALTAVVSAVRIHPSQLAYFNWLAGGPAAGSRYLDDSNIDWGQDLPGLAAWQAEHGIRPLALSYFGTDDPARYGIDSRPMRDEELLRPDRMVYAVSVNVLIGLKLRAQESGRPEFDWLARYTPAATIGYSINLYDFR